MNTVSIIPVVNIELRIPNWVFISTTMKLCKIHKSLQLSETQLSCPYAPGIQSKQLTFPKKPTPDPSPDSLLNFKICSHPLLPMIPARLALLCCKSATRVWNRGLCTCFSCHVECCSPRAVRGWLLLTVQTSSSHHPAQCGSSFHLFFFLIASHFINFAFQDYLFI